MLAATEALLLADGANVSLDVIAERAGVGAGTVHRHFPTKEALFQAVVLRQVEALAEQLAAGADAAHPPAFLDAFTRLVVDGASGHALAAIVTSAGVAVDAAISKPRQAIRQALARLLERAQRANEVRRDLTASDLEALLAGAHAIERHPHGGKRGLGLLCDALRSRR